MQQQQQQAGGAMFPVMPSFPPTNITTEQIQKYLDENKKLILAILDNQNLGKLAECAQYQAQLQKNLMYLAAIADAQPQTQAMPPQMTPHPVMQQGGFYMQHPQAAAAAVAMAQQQPAGGIFASPPRPTPFNNPPHPVQQQDPTLPHPQAAQGHMAMRPAGGPTNGGIVHAPQHDSSVGGVPASNSGNNNNKQDKPDGGAASTASDHRQGNNAAATMQGSGVGEDAK